MGKYVNAVSIEETFLHVLMYDRASQTISLMQRRDSFTTRGSLMARPSQVDRSGSALVDMSHKKLLEDTTRPVWRVNHSGAFEVKVFACCAYQYFQARKTDDDRALWAAPPLPTIPH